MNKKALFFIIIGMFFISHSIFSQIDTNQYSQEGVFLNKKIYIEKVVSNLIKNDIDTNLLRYIPIVNSIIMLENKEGLDKVEEREYVFSQILFINKTSNKAIGSAHFCKGMDGCYLQIYKRKHGNHTLPCFIVDRYKAISTKMRNFIRKKKDCQLIIYNRNQQWIWIDSQKIEHIIKTNKY